MSTIRLAAAAALVLLPVTVGAQTVTTSTTPSTLGGVPLLQERNMPLAAAQQIVQGAIEACLASGYNVTAAVVNRAGDTRALLRADQASPSTAVSALAKAYTSSSIRNSTLAAGDNAANNRASRNLGQIQGFLLVGGGLPVRVGDEVIGAVGVSGAPTPQADEACARAGIERATTSTSATPAPNVVFGGVAGLNGRALSLSAAYQIARVAVAACSERSLNVSAAVVDRGGVVRAVLRADRAGQHTPSAAIDKAYTSVVLRDTTIALLTALESREALERRLNQTARILLLGGGVPVRSGDELIGGVGVGGAPSGQQDEDCAREGIAATNLGLR